MILRVLLVVDVLGITGADRSYGAIRGENVDNFGVAVVVGFRRCIVEDLVASDDVSSKGGNVCAVSEILPGIWTVHGRC